MRSTVISIIFSLFSVFSVAQDNAQAVISAFTDSYTNENNGEYTKGIEVMKKVYNENSYEINLRLGWLHYMAGLFTESMAYYQKAIKLMPYSIEARLGFVYPASALGNWDQVVQQYKGILEIDPNNSLVNYRIGLIYYGREDYTTASKHFEKVVNLYPFDYDGVIMMAWTNFKLGKTREAKILFNKALMLSPGDESATEGIGLLK